MLLCCVEWRSWGGDFSTSCLQAGLSKVTMRSLGFPGMAFPTLNDFDAVMFIFITSLMMAVTADRSLVDLSCRVPSPCSGKLCITMLAFLFSLSRWLSRTRDSSAVVGAAALGSLWFCFGSCASCVQKNLGCCVYASAGCVMLQP